MSTKFAKSTMLARSNAYIILRGCNTLNMSLEVLKRKMNFTKKNISLKHDVTCPKRVYKEIFTFLILKEELQPQLCFKNILIRSKYILTKCT